MAARSAAPSATSHSAAATVTSKPGGLPVASISVLSFAPMMLRKRSFKISAAAQSRLVHVALRDRNLPESNGVFRPAVKTAAMRTSRSRFHIGQLFEVGTIQQHAGREFARRLRTGAIDDRHKSLPRNAARNAKHLLKFDKDLKISADRKACKENYLRTKSYN